MWKPSILDWCWYKFELVTVINITDEGVYINRHQVNEVMLVTVDQLEEFVGKLPTVCEG